METDEFDAKTAAFLLWLSEAGVKTSPKMQLVTMGSGRGVGTFCSSTSVSYYPSISMLLTCCPLLPAGEVVLAASQINQL